MNEFSIRLRLLREQKGISISELALQLDIAKSLLWRYETGKSEPGLSILVKLAEYFGVTLDWIAGNGNRDEIQTTCNKEYRSAVNRCIREDITPEKLEQLIDVIKK